MKGSAGDFSKILFPLLADREPSYKEALNWLQFAFTGNPKIQYVTPVNNAFDFTLPVEGETLFLPALKRLQTLYLRAYARGTTYTSEGVEMLEVNLDDLDPKRSACTHPGDSGLNPSLGGDDL